MGRITYKEEEDFPGQAELWEANQERSLKGKRGLAALQEMETALLAMPDKRLIDHQLIDDSGGVCAIGALARYKGKVLTPSTWEPEDLYDDSSDPQTMEVAAELKIPRLVAMSIIEKNDNGWYRVLTPEQRHEQMLSWVRRRLAMAEQPSTNSDAASARLGSE